MQSQVLLKDSLIKELVRVKNDTSKCNILYELINEIEDNNEWSKYNEELKKICELKLKRISKKDPYYLFYYKYLQVPIIMKVICTWKGQRMIRL